MDEANGLNRRDFISQAAALVAAAQGLGAALTARAQQSVASAPIQPAAIIPAPKDNLVGIQMGPHTLLDEGIDRALDLIQQIAAINTLFVYSHAYGGDLRKPPNILARDHGNTPMDQRAHNLPLVWVKQHEQYYKDTTLRHPGVDATFDFHDHDLFTELLSPARKRGMKIYARILEAGPRGIENFARVATVTVDGRHTQTGCWNHPEYRAFWNATVEDLFRSYELDGFQWGAERSGPLLNVLLNGQDSAATCFCEHCIARGKSKGIDPGRAKEGMAEVLSYVQRLRTGTLKPADGILAGFLRLLFRYPEILAWEYQYRLSREEVKKGMYDTIKKIKPEAPVGWHVDHWAISMDPISRAEMSYAEMAPHSDFLKVVVYHAVLGPRTRSYLTNMQRGVMGDIPLDELFDLHYDLLGYDRAKEPSAAEAAQRGFSPDYVYRETKHSVASAEGKIKIYPGVACNVPGGPADDPDTVYQAVLKAYEAGASGIVVSREYEEITVPNLKAIGRAIRDLKPL
jgi:hypothetical protein